MTHQSTKALGYKAVGGGRESTHLFLLLAFSGIEINKICI
jgi:hypothetical protein